MIELAKKIGNWLYNKGFELFAKIAFYIAIAFMIIGPITLIVFAITCFSRQFTLLGVGYLAYAVLSFFVFLIFAGVAYGEILLFRQHHQFDADINKANKKIQEQKNTIDNLITLQIKESYNYDLDKAICTLNLSDQVFALYDNGIYQKYTSGSSAGLSTFYEIKKIKKILYSANTGTITIQLDDFTNCRYQLNYVSKNSFYISNFIEKVNNKIQENNN